MAFQKQPQNDCICRSLGSGANFPEIAIGYGSPGTNDNYVLLLLNRKTSSKS